MREQEINYGGTNRRTKAIKHVDVSAVHTKHSGRNNTYYSN